VVGEGGSREVPPYPDWRGRFAPRQRSPRASLSYGANTVNWTTRPATVEDKEFLYVLNRAAYEEVVRKQYGQWDEACQWQHFEEKWSPEKFAIVEKAGRRIGTLSVSRNNEEVRIIEIQLLPEFQGRGIGTALLQRELRFANE
jgi:GNAT superfamily N-acetyltransferase